MIKIEGSQIWGLYTMSEASTGSVGYRKTLNSGRRM